MPRLHCNERVCVLTVTPFLDTVVVVVKCWLVVYVCMYKIMATYYLYLNRPFQTEYLLLILFWQPSNCDTQFLYIHDIISQNIITIIRRYQSPIRELIRLLFSTIVVCVHIYFLINVSRTIYEYIYI